MLINYTYCKIYSNDSYHFNTGYKAAKKDLEKSKVIYIYEAATNGTSINEIFKQIYINKKKRNSHLKTLLSSQMAGENLQ